MEVITMIKLSSLMKEEARKTAGIMLKNNLSQSTIPEMPSFLISKMDVRPSGYVSMGNIKVESMKFYLFQKF